MKLFRDVSGRNYVFQYLAAISGSFGVICCGFHYGWTSPALLHLQEDPNFSISNEEGSWMAVMLLFGCACGALLETFIVDIIGRKKVILLSACPLYISWVMIAFAPFTTVFHAARFIAGFGEGLIFTAAPAYFGEISDPKIRGLLGSSLTLGLILGTLVMNIMGSYLSIFTTALIASVFPVLLLITFAMMPESPYFLLMRGKEEAARESLTILKGVREVDEELERLKHTVKFHAENEGSFWDLFAVKSNRKALLTIVILRNVQHFGGGICITFYIQTIFNEANTVLTPTVAATIYFSIELCLTVCSSVMVDRAGRKPLLFVSVTGSAVALFTEALYFFMCIHTDIDTNKINFLPLAALILFIVMYSVGMRSIPLVMVGELFPTSVKRFALCLSEIYYSLLAAIVSKLFQITKDEFGMYTPFFVFTACCILNIIFIKLWVPETKGKTLEEIQEYLKR